MKNVALKNILMMCMQRWMVPETRETEKMLYELVGVFIQIEGDLFWAVTDKS